MQQVHVVTGGFYGVGDVIGHSYHEKRCQMGWPSNIWHILPVRDNQDFSRKCVQNADKSFAPLSYGRTLFVGDSVRQREQLMARAFDICIVVEGGPGAAHEAEQFAWYDHVVIPVRSTGGAAAGKFKVPKKIFEVPADVDAADWSILADSSASADAIGSTVNRIISSVSTRLSLESPMESTCHDSALPDFSTATTPQCLSPSHQHDISTDD